MQLKMIRGTILVHYSLLNLTLSIITVIQIFILYLKYDFVILWYFRRNLCFKNNKIILSFKNPYFSGSPIVFEKCSSCLLQLKGQCNGLLFQRKIKILKKYSLLSEFCIHCNFTAQCSVVRNWYQHVYIQTATFLPSWLQLFNLKQV